MPAAPENLDKSLAINEFKSVITTYILPIFGAIGDLSLCETPEINRELFEIISNDNHCYAKFYPQISKNDVASPFHYEIEIYDQGEKNTPQKALMS